MHNNKFIQSGVILGGLESEREKIQKIADKITNSIEGLFGIIGVDIVKFKGEWHVIEINPRFTSAFIGLYDSIGKEMIKKITDFYIFRKLKIIKLESVKKVRVNF
jgi:predicted ATP-grasp superfamily ATP-dependent carboligase